MLEGLAALGDNSLVRLDESGLDPRYRMLETIREFAVEQLAARDDDGRVRDAHAEYMHGFAAQFDQAMFDPERRALLGRSESELANVRAALGWLEQRGDAEQLLNLAAKTWGMLGTRQRDTRMGATGPHRSRLGRAGRSGESPRKRGFVGVDPGRPYGSGGLC